MKDGKPVIIEVHSHVPMLSNSMSYISIFLKILVSFLTLMQIWLIWLWKSLWNSEYYSLLFLQVVVEGPICPPEP
jgi:hypothetical protein